MRTIESASGHLRTFASPHNSQPPSSLNRPTFPEVQSLERMKSGEVRSPPPEVQERAVRVGWSRRRTTTRIGPRSVRSAAGLAVCPGCFGAGFGRLSVTTTSLGRNSRAIIDRADRQHGGQHRDRTSEDALGVLEALALSEQLGGLPPAGTYAFNFGDWTTAAARSFLKWTRSPLLSHLPCSVGTLHARSEFA